jgi:predicted anti-sigma-YlaC factor YlaD
VVGIVVDDDGIAVPVPVIGVVVIVGSYAEIEGAEPEAVAVSTSQVILMAAAKAAGKAAVFPGMIEVIVRVAATGIVTDPVVIVVDVRRVRMIGPIAEGATVVLIVAVRSAIFGSTILRAVRRSASRGSRTVGGNMAAAHIVTATAATALCTSAGWEKRGRSKRQE